MATGVLVLGVNRATRLLGHLMLTEKSYDATIRLGVSTTTDDAEGEVLATADTDGLDEAAVRRVLAGFVGEIDQVPTAVSAIKVDGKRAYQRVREGEQVELQPRRVTIHDLTVLDVDWRPTSRISVRCSSGTYIRAIARDAGAALGVGGHLTALRRTAVGEFGLDRAHTLEELTDDFAMHPDRRGCATHLPVGGPRRATGARRPLRPRARGDAHRSHRGVRSRRGVPRPLRAARRGRPGGGGLRLTMHRPLIHRETMYSRRMTEQAMYILASLAQGELHGYGIARDVEELSDGRVRLTAGTLYGALNRLTADGLVEPAGEQQVQGRRRRYYRLTATGHTELSAEVERLRSTAAALAARASAARRTPGLA